MKSGHLRLMPFHLSLVWRRWPLPSGRTALVVAGKGGKCMVGLQRSGRTGRGNVAESSKAGTDAALMRAHLGARRRQRNAPATIRAQHDRSRPNVDRHTPSIRRAFSRDPGPALLAFFRERPDGALNIAERHFGRHEYAIRDRVTVADLPCAPICRIRPTKQGMTYPTRIRRSLPGCPG